MKDIAICVCHGVAAWLETDVTPPVWMCEIDDKVCEVKFEEAK